jgi:hypothetical protein
LTGVRWNLNVILICISFLAKDVEDFFMITGHLYFFENCLFSSFAHLFSGLLSLWEVRFLSSLYIFWLLIPCQMYSWQRFSPIL